MCMDTLPACMPGVCGCQKRLLGPLKLELQAVVETSTDSCLLSARIATAIVVAIAIVAKIYLIFIFCRMIYGWYINLFGILNSFDRIHIHF